MRVNISLRPRKDINYDLHLPVPLIVTPSPDPKINATEKQILDTFSSVEKSTSLIVGENGGPPAWSERVAKVLIKHGYTDVSVDQNFDRDYFNADCKMFPDSYKPYRYVPVDKDLVDRIKSFFEFYKSATWTIDEPKSGVTGHYYRGRMLWTQVQKRTDPAQTKNPELMSSMKNLLPEITNYLQTTLEKFDMDMDRFEERITLRLVDYVNTPGINATLGSHIDASLITGVLYEDNPGLHVRDYHDDSLSIDRSTIVEASEPFNHSQAVFFPGNILSDELRVWAPACWHGVQIDDQIQRRLSFLIRIESLDLE